MERAASDFEAFFADHHAELGGVAYRLCGRVDTAEEVTADAFAQAWRRWGEISRAQSPATEVHGIVTRLAEERGRAAIGAPTGEEPQGTREIDGARLRALLEERIALAPMSESATLALEGVPLTVAEIASGSGIGSGGGSNTLQRTAGEGGRFLRPRTIGIAVGANAVAALIAIAVIITGGGSPAPSDPTTPLTDANASGSATGSSRAGSTTDLAASASAGTSNQLSTAPADSAPSSTRSAHGTATPDASARTSSSTKLLTVGASVATSKNSSTQLEVTTSVRQSLSALTITIEVAHCQNLRETGAWDSGANGQFTETTTVTGDGAIIYSFSLTAGYKASPDSVTFTAQFSHSPGSWTASADTYSVRATSAATGTAQTAEGIF